MQELLLSTTQEASSDEAGKKRFFAGQRAARMAVSLELDATRRGYSMMPSGINANIIKPAKDALRSHDEARANDVINMNNVDVQAIDALRPDSAHAIAVTPPSPQPFEAPNTAK